MTTTAIGTGSSTAAAAPPKSAYSSLKPDDFIKMMVTQLQHQDPMQPTSNQDLLAQMSQIGQLESSTQLQTALQSFSLQTQIGSASALIGKAVQGLDDSNNPIQGVVNSVQVQNNGVSLQLDSGATLGLGRVTSISGAPTAAPKAA